MTLNQGFLWVAEVLMASAFACFLRAFSLRKRDVGRHMSWGKAGAYQVFAGLILLEVLRYGVGWEFPVRSPGALRVHLISATVSLVVIIALLVTGVTRRRSIHTRLYWVFFPSYIATLITSLLAFEFL